MVYDFATEIPGWFADYYWLLLYVIFWERECFESLKKELWFSTWKQKWFYLTIMSDDVVDLPFRAEYAKSGRAACKVCKEKIDKGVLRLAIMVQVRLLCTIF